MVGLGKLLSWVLIAMIILVANADERPQGPSEQHDESLRESGKIERLLSEIPPTKAYLPAGLQKSAKMVEPRYQVGGHAVSLESLVDDNQELQNLGEDNYYGESSYGETAERGSVELLQMGEGHQQQRYPWVISQDEAQKREKKLVRQKAAQHRDDTKLKGHEVPLKDTLNGVGVRQRVQEELKRFQASHKQEAQADRSDDLGDTRGFAASEEKAQVQKKEVHDFDDSVERKTLEKVRALGGRDHGNREHSTFREDVERLQHHRAAAYKSAWGDDADDNDDDDDSPFGYRMELLQSAESSKQAAPDMMAILASKMAGKTKRTEARAVHQQQQRRHQGNVKASEPSIKAQRAFTAQLEKQTAARTRADSAGLADMGDLVKHRHEKSKSNGGFQFVPKNQVELKRNEEVAREVAMQKQLASSFKLAMHASAPHVQQDSSDAGNLKQPSQVRDLFDSHSDGVSLKVAEKLQPRLKKKDSTWQTDAAQEIKMAKQAAKMMNDKSTAAEIASTKKHDMKELFPDHAHTMPEKDETGMSFEHLEAAKADQHLPADAQKLLDMSKMMVLATQRTTKATEGIIDADGNKLRLSGVTGKSMMKKQFELTPRHFDANHPNAGKTSTQQIRAKALKYKSQKSLKLAQRFLKRTKMKLNVLDKTDAQDTKPLDKKGFSSLFSSRRHPADQAEPVEGEHHSRLSAEDKNQVAMQQQFAQAAKAGAAADKASTELGEDGDNSKQAIASLFSKQHKAHRAKQSKQAELAKITLEAELDKEDVQSKAMQQGFAEAQKSRHTDHTSEPVPETRKGLKDLMTHRTAGPQRATKLSTATNANAKMQTEFEMQKKLQLSMLNHMKKQQLASAKAETGTASDQQMDSKEKLQSLFAVHGRNKKAASHQWSKQQARQGMQKAKTKQADQSVHLEDHLHTTEQVEAPKTAPATKPEGVLERLADSTESLAQQDVGEIAEVSGPAAIRKKMTRKMKAHFVDLLNQNKGKFKQMMSTHGVDGAADFYKNMKADLQSMMQPPEDSLIQTDAGTDTEAAATATAAVADTATAAAAAAATAAAAEASKVADTSNAKLGEAEQVSVTKEASPVQKPSTMDLKSLEQAVDMLSPEDRQKFIMHRLQKLAN